MPQDEMLPMQHGASCDAATREGFSGTPGENILSCMPARARKE